MRKSVGIALLPLVINNYETSVSALSVRSPLHMTHGDKAVSNRKSIPSTTVLASTAPSPLEPPPPSSKKRNKLRRNGRRKSKAKAPLVDSTLLRFLSAQKSQLKQTEGAVGESSKDITSSTGIEIKKVVADPKESMAKNDNSKGDKPSQDMANSISESRASKATVEDTTADILSWFTQYNAHRIALKLKSLGASEESALEAGNAVQKYSLARTTRQRVRKFLRDRDLKWTSGNTDVEEPAAAVSDLRAEAEMRGKIYDVDAVVALLVDAGLTGRDIASIFTHTPSISMMKAKKGDVENDGETLEDTLNRSFTGVLCSTVKLRKYDARKVLRTCPGLLTKRGSVSAEEVVSILSNLGVVPTSLCRDKAALPMLLSRSPASLFRFVAFLSSDYVRMPVSKIGPFIRRSECSSVLDLIAPLPRYNSNLLGGMDGLNLNEDEIDAMPIEKLLKDGSTNMENEITARYSAMFETAGFLRREVGIEDMGKVLAAYPQILIIDKNKVVEIVNFLQEESGMYHYDVARMIEAYPMILETEISQIQSIIDYLRSLEVSEDVLGSILRAFPALFSQNPNASMKEVVKFLEEIGVTNIGRFITRLPPVLSYSVQKDLKPRWDYLRSVSQFASFEVGRFPAYFSYPFDRVIKSRYEYMRDVKRIPVQLLPVDEILRYGDKDFATIVARDKDESNYTKFLMQRNEKRKRKRGRRKKAIN